MRVLLFLLTIIMANYAFAALTKIDGDGGSCTIDENTVNKLSGRVYVLRSKDGCESNGGVWTSSESEPQKSEK